MKGLLDLVALLGGIFGLGGMLFNGTPLTAETATLYIARAMIVMAFVVVPFYMARAIEKVHAEAGTNKPDSSTHPDLRSSRKGQTAETPTPFFDYFFLPGSAREWKNTSRNTFVLRNTLNSNRTVAPE